MKRLVGTIVLAVIIFLSSVLLPFAHADWPMFHLDPSHSGAVGNLTHVPTQSWTYTTESDVFSSPAVVDSNLYIGSLDKNVYALNATNGIKIWNYTTSGYVISSPAVVNGMVFVCSSKVY